MNFWEKTIKFHKSIYAEHEKGKKGFAAVKYLRDVFEYFPNHSFSHRHPIGTRLLRASVQDYEWLIQFARKMQILKSIDGSEALFSRLTRLDEVYQALAEVEVALKLKLAGFKVMFVERAYNVQTPDLLVKSDSLEVNVEIITLNSPDFNIRLNDFYFKIHDFKLNLIIPLMGKTFFGLEIVKKRGNNLRFPFLVQLPYYLEIMSNKSDLMQKMTN